jgi:DNA-binding NtrC family response regulator
MADKVLITMDDLEVAVQSNAAFEAAGTETILVSSLDDSKAVLRRSDPDVVVLTNALHEHRVEVLVALARDREISTLGLIEATTPDAAGLVRRLGLTAWMRKPAEPREIVATATRLIERRRLQQRTKIVGESPALQEVLVKIEQIAPVASTVLVEGESGTGKELVAQAIHSLSPRRDKPFIAVNCAALTETLLESELFGHEKGAFTGAAERRLGRFELADGGTIFLDEVGAMPGATQVKLLRVLETRAFFRVGGSQPIRVNVRVVAASNQSLKELVAMGKFREDLFFRLNVLYMYLPPLRERKSDIPLLVKQFVKELSVAHGRSFRGMTDGAMEILVNAHWPGNARQLRNLIESMVVLAPGKEIHASDIPPEIREGGTRLLPVPVPGATRDVQGQELEFILRSLVELKLQIEDLRRRLWPQVTEYEDITPGRERPSRGEHDERESAVVYRPGMKMAEVERATIEAALRVTEGNRRRAAEELGIGERTLYRKIQVYNLT